MRARKGRLTKTLLGVFLILWCGVMISGYFNRHHVAVFDPAGTIAAQERRLIFIALGLCAIVVVPVYLLTVTIAINYREGNKKPKKYRPDWDGNRLMEGIWWAIPFAIITTLAIITWNSSYKLDPYKALAASQPAVNVQVVALDWKWLFVYPDQKIASVNWLELPAGQPINFHITSDSVMNSFWVPSLGSQIYAMPGMDTQLHLMADRVGAYHGSSANISGQGFAGMTFTANVVTPADFKAWSSDLQRSDKFLTASSYAQLAQPSQNNSKAYYRLNDQNLYYQVIRNYLGPPGGNIHGGIND